MSGRATLLGTPRAAAGVTDGVWQPAGVREATPASHLWHCLGLTAIRSASYPKAHAMALRLIIEDEEGATTIVPLGEEEVTIGREPGNTIQLTEQNVSRQHARLTQGSDGWVIEDLDSYNGVKVNGVLVEGSVTLNEGDVVQIGDYHLALSNNVEQTTLNIDRPGQAANEPNRVMPSVDLPRISATEAAGLATPSSSGASGDERDRDRSEGGGNKGLIVVLSIVAVLGLGFIGFRLLGLGDKPQANPGERGATAGATAPAANDTAANSKPPATQAVTPDPVPTPPVPTPPVPTPEPVDPDPSAADVEPPIEEEPTKKPAVKTTPKPKSTEPKAKPDVPKGDPVALLEDARKASMASNATQAYDLARKSYEIDRNTAALKLMGLSACKMGDQAKAKSAYKKLDAGQQKQLQTVCQDNGITLE